MGSVPDPTGPVHADSLLAGYCQRIGLPPDEARRRIERLRRDDARRYRLAAEALADDGDAPVTRRELGAALDSLRDELADVLATER